MDSIMKKLSFYLLTILFFSIRVNAQWVPVNNGLDNKGVFCILIKDTNVFIGTDEGVFYSSDYGDSWSEKNSGITYPGISNLVLIGDIIFAGTFGEGVFLTTDNGNNWIAKNDSISNFSIYSMAAGGNKIFIGSLGRGIYKSLDSGNTWIDITYELSFIIHFNSLAINGNNLFVGIGGAAGVYLSTDEGNSWIPKNTGLTNLYINHIEINNDSIFIATGGGVFLSVDSGSNWSAKNSGLTDTNVHRILVYGNNIFAGTFFDGIYLSTDSGDSWSVINDGLTDKGLWIFSLAIVGDFIFAGTKVGIFRANLSDFGITDVKEQEQKNEIKIYPNPASNEFRLKFHSPIETTVQINIFDLLGNCVMSRTEQASEGTNEKNINCEKLPHGYYYVKININEIVETIPLVIIK
ncbi:MAG: T9SS type A sorting domain-containing protein [Bacteroidetes bacterium]|nr:MAG: T9SS type A sorting domain-containing protein [Bacteroidota bacterium]